MPDSRHIPVRQCLGCGERLPKSELIRILRTPEGEITVDASSKANGRGAYICGKPGCIAKLRKNRRVDSALGVKVPDGIWDRLNSGNNDR